MTGICSRTVSLATALTLCLFMSAGPIVAETLNPTGINPHAAAPRKRITQEQKKAAAEARKQRMAETAARNAARKAGETSTPGTNLPKGSDRPSSK